MIFGERTRMGKQKVWWQFLIVLTALAVFFTLLFYVDNKYQTPPPYGKSGFITLCGEDLERSTPVYLIDGWLLTDERVTDKPTYIGEFSSLQRGNLLNPPHGKARYRMTLRYEGAPQIVSADFQQLAFEYVLFLDGMRLAEGKGNGRITFWLTEGEHVLTVETASEAGYYSGMYFPPALGTEETLSRLADMRSFSYALAVLVPLTLAVFTFFMWRTGGSLIHCFGTLCCCYALYMFRHFVYLFSMPVAEYWFLVQSLALYCLCYCVVWLTALASENGAGRAWRWIKLILLVLPVCMTALAAAIPALTWAVWLHGKLTDIYYVFTFGSAAFFAAKGVAVQSPENRYTLAGSSVFGAGMMMNLFFSNRFEPIRFFWQFEWCGLLLVLLFGAMMVARGCRILRENDALNNHLEEQVRKRTAEVTQLLEERKAFFSDMAHDLKAPVFATQSFIEAIRRSGVGVDMELQGYLDQAEARQREMARRLQGLSSINELDRIKGEMVRISLRETLLEIYAIHRGEAEVRSVHLSVEPPEPDVFLTAQPEKLNILFENLLYNALKATPGNGSITISARTEDGEIRVTVKDTGCGIPAEELPYVFQRFYVGADNRETGTGLGLYIAQSIVAEMGGTISVQSTVGKGTAFTMYFPQNAEAPRH